MSDAAEEQAWHQSDAVIRDETGLHARPAVRLTKLAKQFAARVEIRADGHENWVNAKSPNAVMKLKASHDSRLNIRAAGDDAEAAVAALAGLVDRNFDD
ncbi:MAG: HPr family phosphocarrier protein [Pseudomonadota bacterium]